MRTRIRNEKNIGSVMRKLSTFFFFLNRKQFLHPWNNRFYYIGILTLKMYCALQSVCKHQKWVLRNPSASSQRSSRIELLRMRIWIITYRMYITPLFAWRVSKEFIVIHAANAMSRKTHIFIYIFSTAMISIRQHNGLVKVWIIIHGLLGSETET